MHHGFMKPHDIFAVVQPGLEDVAEREITALGHRNTERIKGGFFLKGHLSTVMKLNSSCRCLSRLLIKIAEFDAKSFVRLEKQFSRRWLGGIFSASRIAEKLIL